MSDQTGLLFNYPSHIYQSSQDRYTSDQTGLLFHYPDVCTR